MKRKRSWDYFKHHSGISSGESEKNTKASEFSCLDQDFNPGFHEYGALLLLTTAIFGLCICLDAVSQTRFRGNLGFHRTSLGVPREIVE